MKSVAPVLSVLLLTALAAKAQTFRFDDGRTASVPDAVVRGSEVVVKVALGGGGVAETPYPVSRISSMDWPEPAELERARAALAADNPGDALALVEGVISAQEPFRTVSGSWWPEAASIRVRALARLRRSVDAEVALERLRLVNPPVPVLVRAESAMIAILLEEGRVELARDRIAKIRSTAIDDTSLAGLAILQGDLDRKTGAVEPALLSYLRVPVYHSSEKELLPLALKGAIACLETLGDTKRAEQLAKELRQLR